VRSGLTPCPKFFARKPRRPCSVVAFPIQSYFRFASFMRRLPESLATTHILLCGLIFGSAIANPQRAGLLPLIALPIDWPASLAFNGVSDALIGFPRNKLLWDAAFYMVLGTIWFYWIGCVLQVLFRWATNTR